MAGYRKLGRTSSQRKALLRIQATNLLYHGKIVTTEARAKEVRKIVESLIALAVKEKDNFETVKVTAKVARKDADGKRVKEVVDGKKVTVYDEVEKTIKKDKPSRLHARRQMLKVLFPVKEGEKTTSAADQEKIAELFPNTYGEPEVTFEKGQNTSAAKKQVVGVILSGGQAPGGHNVVSGLYDALKATNKENVLIGFKGGPSGLIGRAHV